jgi:hypothetical protein
MQAHKVILACLQTQEIRTMFNCVARSTACASSHQGISKSKEISDFGKSRGRDCSQKAVTI